MVMCPICLQSSIHQSVAGGTDCSRRNFGLFVVVGVVRGLAMRCYSTLTSKFCCICFCFVSIVSINPSFHTHYHLLSG